jgi:uncharacterized membrane protein
MRRMGMRSYFELFGPVPTFSNHAWRLLHERGLSLAALRHALTTQAKPGTTTETVIYSDEQITAVVSSTSGLIVTLWWNS